MENYSWTPVINGVVNLEVLTQSLPTKENQYTNITHLEITDYLKISIGIKKIIIH